MKRKKAKRLKRNERKQTIYLLVSRNEAKRKRNGFCFASKRNKLEAKMGHPTPPSHISRLLPPLFHPPPPHLFTPLPFKTRRGVSLTASRGWGWTLSREGRIWPPEGVEDDRWARRGEFDLQKWRRQTAGREGGNLIARSGGDRPLSGKGGIWSPEGVEYDLRGAILISFNSWKFIMCKWKKLKNVDKTTWPGDAWCDDKYMTRAQLCWWHDGYWAGAIGWA